MNNQSVMISAFQELFLDRIIVFVPQLVLFTSTSVSDFLSAREEVGISSPVGLG